MHRDYHTMITWALRTGTRHLDKASQRHFHTCFSLKKQRRVSFSPTDAGSPRRQPSSFDTIRKSGVGMTILWDPRETLWERKDESALNQVRRALHELFPRSTAPALTDPDQFLQIIRQGQSV